MTTEACSESCQTSKMEYSSKIVTSLIIFVKQPSEMFDRDFYIFLWTINKNAGADKNMAKTNTKKNKETSRTCQKINN